MQMVYEDRVIRMCDFAGPQSTIEGYTFNNCFVRGPAVIVVQNDTFSNSTFQGDPEAMLWPILPPRTSVIGAILVKDCTFERCVFSNVGFAGPPEFIESFRSQVGGAP